MIKGGTRTHRPAEGAKRPYTYDELVAEMPETNRPCELWDGESIVSDLYEQYEIKEFWLIDPEAQTIEVLHLQDGHYHLLLRSGLGQVARSRLLPDFEVSASELFKQD